MLDLWLILWLMSLLPSDAVSSKPDGSERSDYGPESERPTPMLVIGRYTSGIG